MRLEVEVSQCTPNTSRPTLRSEEPVPEVPETKVENATDGTGSDPKNSGVVRRFLPWILLLASFGVAAVFWFTIFNGVSDDFDDLYKRNFIVIVGLPLAACAALALVVFLEQAQEGPLEFSGLSFQFKGASGPVVLWVFCYLALVSSFKLLWVPEPESPEAQTPAPTASHSSVQHRPATQSSSVVPEIDVTPRGTVRQPKGEAGW